MNKRSKILIDLINEEIDIKEAFQLLSLLLEDLGNNEIKNWLDYELNGYPKDADVPKYRIINASITGTIKTYTAIISEYDIPVPIEEKEKLCKHVVRNSIAEICQYAKVEEETNTHCLLSPIDIGYINSVALINKAEVTHANLQLSMYGYTNILHLLKNKLIDIFKKLERQYGNLDEYYIDFKSYKDKRDTTEKLLQIIYNDNSIKVGSNNKINKSVIGSNNEITNEKENRFVLKNIIIPIIVGLVISGIVFFLKWN